MNGSATDRSSQPRLLVARIIAGSLFGGPVLLWIVGWWLLSATRGGDPLSAGGLGAVALWIWAGVALPAFVAGFVFRHRALAVVEAEARSGGPVDDPRLAADALKRIQTSLLVAWALFEGPALLSGVLFLLDGDPVLVLGGAALLVLGFAATFPRRAWYEPFERVLDEQAAAEGPS